MQKLIKDNFYLILLFIITSVIFAITVRINVFKYNNFDFGKFDLGNMTQMVWNASRGKGLYLTDYFGTNLPRWAMSHVDPILFIFVPVFVIFPSALTLVISQLVLVIFSTIIIYLIAKLHLKSGLAAFMIGLAYLFNPAVGYLATWTAFHGVTAVIPFFLLAFYIFEKMYVNGKYTRAGLIAFWVFLVLTMMGKEQLPLYVFLYGAFIFLFRNGENLKIKSMFKTTSGKTAVAMMAVSFAWFVTAFFIIIPKYSHYRVEGYRKFAKSMEIEGSAVRDVSLPNYFLNRYNEFGQSYTDVMINVILQPQKTVRVMFGGQKAENFRRTLEPLAYLPVAYPPLFIIAMPDFLINYLTTEDGIGTAEITNHRVSMIIPVLFIAAIFAIGYLGRFFKEKIDEKKAIVFLSVVVIAFTFYTTHYYNNPIFLWIESAVNKKIVPLVFAKTDEELIGQNHKPGDVVKISELEYIDRECAAKIVNIIPDEASVSGPDSLGAHLAKRETYAIYPALYNEADYVIVDVFSQKIITILDVQADFSRDIVKEIIKDENYQLFTGCGNYFVFKKVGPHDKQTLLPVQERFVYDEKINMPFFQGINVVDFSIPKELEHGKNSTIKIVYKRTGDNSSKETKLDDYTMFSSFVNKKTGEIYQMANLPSFSIKKPEDWEENRYYPEEIEVVIPQFLDSGDYMFFVGMGNKIRTRSIYLADIKIK